MKGLNQVILEGRIEDAEVISHGLRIWVSYVHEYRNQNGEVMERENSVFEVESYGKTAEAISLGMRKSPAIRIVGCLKQRVYRENGRIFTNTVIIAEHAEFKA